MKTRISKKTLTNAVSAAIASTTLGVAANVSASENPFQLTNLPSGYMVAAGGGGIGAMDRNGDGTISWTEWDQEFAKMDKNGDGRISGSEMQHVKAQGQMPPDESVKRTGSTGDNKLGDGKCGEGQCGTDAVKAE